MAEYRVTAFVEGIVQGVGFRWWVSGKAGELGLEGYARNLPDGRVEVLAQGTRDAVVQLVGMLREQPSAHRRPGRVTGVTVHEAPPVAGQKGFSPW